MAAIQDSTADNSVGNVTGSNAVNVFLGIGIAWSLASFYHKFHNRQFNVKAGKWVLNVYRDYSKLPFENNSPLTVLNESGYNTSIVPQTYFSILWKKKKISFFQSLSKEKIRLRKNPSICIIKKTLFLNINDIASTHLLYFFVVYPFISSHDPLYFIVFEI